VSQVGSSPPRTRTTKPRFRGFLSVRKSPAVHARDEAGDAVGESGAAQHADALWRLLEVVAAALDGGGEEAGLLGDGPLIEPAVDDLHRRLDRRHRSTRRRRVMTAGPRAPRRLAACP
jgi:hypothetical protein